MRHVYGNAFATAMEMQGQFVPGRDKIVTPFKWAGCARHLWPLKTAICIADITGKDERTAKRWLAGEFDAPPILFARMQIEWFKRENE